MERKILVAVDDSPYTKKCLAYIADLFSGVPKFCCTLCHIRPIVPPFLYDEAAKDPWANAELIRIGKKNAQAAERKVAGAKVALMGMGFPENRISVSTPSRREGVAKDILEFALAGMFDAIVVGRRGISGLQQALMGSVSAKLVEHCQASPVWVLDGNPKGRRFLLAVDGSENAMRLVDHVGFILAGDPAAHVILFHVPQSTGDFVESGVAAKSSDIDRFVKDGDRSMIGAWFDRAEYVLGNAGLGSRQIERVIARGQGRTAKRILETAAKKDCTTVVVGKRGINKAFFFGSVSHAVAHGIRNRAMWLVP
ncbi:MAG: universal stress protein [Pseudomonadota bacterium]